MASSRGMDPFIYTYGETHRLYYRKANNPGVQAYLNSLENDDRLCQVEEYSLSQGEQVSGFLLIDKRKNLEPVYKGLKQKYPDGLSIYFAEDIAMTGYYWLQSFHQEAVFGRAEPVCPEPWDLSLTWGTCTGIRREAFPLRCARCV